MRILLISILILIPFITNGLSLIAGMMLYFWQIFQRRRRHELRTEGDQ